MKIPDRIKGLMSPTRKKVVANVAWATIGKIVRVFTDVLVSIFVARYLGPSQYGLMSYVVSFISIFSIIADFGLDNIEIREIAKPNSDKNVIIGTAFTLRLSLAIFAFLAIGVDLLISHKDTETTVMICIYSLIILFKSCNVIRNYFTAIVKNKYVVISEIVRSIIMTAVKVVLLLVKAPLIFFVAALMMDFAVVAGGYITSYKNTVGRLRDWTFDKNVAKYLLKESFPLLLSGAAIVIYQKIDQVIIKNLLDNESVGYFSVAIKFAEFILFIPMTMSQTIAPLLVKDFESDKERYKIRSQFFVDSIVWISIGCAIFVSCFSYYLIKYTFGSQYMAAVPVLQIMAFKTVGTALSNTSGQLIIIEGKQKWAAIRNLFACVICVSFNYLLIPKYGIIGSAWTTIITVAFSGFLGNFIIRPYRQIFKIQVKSLTTGLIRLAKPIINKRKYGKFN